MGGGGIPRDAWDTTECGPRTIPGTNAGKVAFWRWDGGGGSGWGYSVGRPLLTFCGWKRLEELELRLGGEGVKVPMLRGEWHRSEVMSEVLVLRLVLVQLGGSGRPATARSAPTTAEVGPQEGWV